jgi:hypothetical protein
MNVLANATESNPKPNDVEVGKSSGIGFMACQLKIIFNARYLFKQVKSYAVAVLEADTAVLPILVDHAKIIRYHIFGAKQICLIVAVR